MEKSLPNHELVNITNGINRAHPSLHRHRGASPVDAGILAKHERLRHILYRGFR
jgi:hypothetical protein